MFVRRSLILWALLFVMQNYLSAQEKPDLKFGKVSASDFDLSRHNFDTSAGAVIISDIGSAEFDSGKEGDFTLVYNYYRRVKILSKNGFEAASFAIPVYDYNKQAEKLIKIKANTYNIDNGKIVVAELEPASVFTEKLSEKLNVIKFTLPAVKEGSIIEVMYTLRSDFFFQIRSWNFQGRYPILWSDFTLRIPDFFNYTILSQGFHPFHIKNNSTSFKYYYILFRHDKEQTVYNNATHPTDGINIKADVGVSRWVMKDVPPIKEEKYITSLNNYIAKLQFQLSETRDPYEDRNYRTSWTKLAVELSEHERFGSPLNPQVNYWLSDDIRRIVKDAATPLEKVQRIYAFVRDNFTCTNYNSFLIESSLRDAFSKRKGTVGDINLLLIAMLKHENIRAEPVLLSTRGHGYAYEEYPLLTRFNYVIAAVTIDNKKYYLDATEPKLGFARLPLRCYNGQARIMRATNSDSVYLLPDSLKETKISSVFISNDKNGRMAGSFQSTPGYYESMETRDRISDQGKEEFLKGIRLQHPRETQITDLEIDALNNFDAAVTVRYNFGFEGLNENIVYFNPMFGQGMEDNFKSARRFYPVELPFAFDEVYTLNMEVPAGYTVDEMPKSTRVNLNDGDGMFEYLVSESNGRIMLRSRLKIVRTYFSPTDYENLRGFFDLVVKKHAENIVFKKKN